MGTVVLGLLVGLWASLLLPRALRAWREARPMGSVDSFEHTMSRLSPMGSGAGRHILVPGQPSPQAGRARVVARRRVVLAALVAVAVNALAAALLFGGALWTFGGFALLSLGGYVGVLAQLEARRAERRRKVRRLPRPQPAAASAGRELERTRSA